DSHVSLNDFPIPEMENEDDANDNFLFATNLSPIKLGSMSPMKSSKRIEVYEDSPDPAEVATDAQTAPLTDLEAKIERLAQEAIKRPSSRKGRKSTKKVDEIEKVVDTTKADDNSTLETDDNTGEDSDEHKPLEPDVSKIKHTKNKKLKSKSSTDEEMPGSIDSEDASGSRSRRSSRGKQVSYAEPSLRSKMRRQSEKFVDAAAEDAYIRPVSRSAGLSKESTPVDPSTEEQSMEISTASEMSGAIPQKRVSVAKEVENPATEAPSRQAPLTVQDNVNITKRRKPLGALSKNKIQKVDNKSFKKSKPFALDELSVFDLVEEAAVGVPKTYKGKPDITTRRRKSSERRHSAVL
ncbi:Shugoshin, partial [Cyberlindnera fabianii]